MELDNINKRIDDELNNSGTEATLDLTIGLTDLLGPVATISKEVFKRFQTHREHTFYRKLTHFLFPSRDIPQSDMESFISSLGKDNERIADYLINLIELAESYEETEVYGILYKATSLGDIDTETLLRLLSMLKNVYIPELKNLPMYVGDVSEEGPSGNLFINWGFIDNFPGGIWSNSPNYQLNELGENLHNILDKYKWFDKA